MEIRNFEKSDAKRVVEIICRNFLEVNIKDYSKENIEKLIATHNDEWVLVVASYANMYVFCINKEIIGVGAISSFWGSLDESILLTVFVVPELHGQGIGRKIVETLEQDELFLRAKRIEIPASITACEFYRKMGYGYKNGIKELDGEGHYRMEKHRKVY